MDSEKIGACFVGFVLGAIVSWAVTLFVMDAMWHQLLVAKDMASYVVNENGSVTWQWKDSK